ncbi:MAG: DUF362 domain-containing protein [Candidatus Aminicenantia bacterium]
MGKKYKVIIRKVKQYEPSSIKEIIKSGLEELNLIEKAKGRITIKPNVVMAHPKIAPSGYTRPEFLDGLLEAIEEIKKDNFPITIAEKCGVGLPTTRMFKRAGYYQLKKKHKVKLVPIEESKKVKVPLKKGIIHKELKTAKEIIERDFLIYAPKLKSNVLSQGLTAALKLNIGILLDKQRMWHHHYDLDDKIVDMLEIGYPDFIATDAIEIAVGGNQFTQHGRDLGVIIMSDNPLAHDVVCANILHLKPNEINYLKKAHQRGYGPISLNEIEISGDISLDEIYQKTKHWEIGYKRVDQIDCNFKILCGEPYCIGGCNGVFLDWLYMIKDRKPKLFKNLPSWTVVIGKYEGDVTCDKLMIIGDCSEVKGEISAKKIRRIKGCPPRHKDLVLKFFLKTGILNPLFRLDLIIDAYFFLFLSWLKRLVTGRW